MLLDDLKAFVSNAFTTYIAPFIDPYSTIYRPLDTNIR